MDAEPEPVGRLQGSALTQFKPGQSGNPNGRAKGSRNKLVEDFIADTYAKILVPIVEMFAYATRKVVLASMRAHADDAISAMRLLTLFEQNIDTVLGHLRQILALEARKTRKNVVKVLAPLGHETCGSSHRNCLPKESPSIGTV
jgi:hypothetical protein